jgi:hypothetical protein
LCVKDEKYQIRLSYKTCFYSISFTYAEVDIARQATMIEMIVAKCIVEINYRIVSSLRNCFVGEDEGKRQEQKLRDLRIYSLLPLKKVKNKLAFRESQNHYLIGLYVITAFLKFG